MARNEKLPSAPLRSPFNSVGDIFSSVWQRWFIQIHSAVAEAATAPTGGSRSDLNLSVDGTLAIGSSMAPIQALAEDATAAAVVCAVELPPIGADITIGITVDGAVWMTLVIPNGQNKVVATAGEIAAAGSLGAGSVVGIQLSTVGTTFPGSDLTVTIARL